MIWFHESVQDLLVDADAIHPNPRNPNNGDVDAIVESLNFNGCYRPIYVARESKEIVAGHNLYEALLREGCEQVPVMWIDGDSAQARRILLADNQIAALARMDDGLLLELLEDVMREDSLLGTGFVEDDVAKLREEQAPPVVDEENHDPFEATTMMTCPECGHTWGLRKESLF